MQIPKVKKVAHTLEEHGDTREDNFYWLKDREDNEVIEYLEAENTYYKESMAGQEQLKMDLFKELKSRIKEEDSSVPYFYNGYYYINRYEQGKEYPIYSRKKGSLEAPEEVMFDCNQMAESHDYFKLGGIEVSSDNKFAIFATDTVGRRIYTLKIKNLQTGEILEDVIENTAGVSAWANDNKTIFYTNQDQVTLRSDKIFRHIVGIGDQKDELIFHEEDDTFDTFVYKSKSEKYLVIGSTSTLTSEYQILDADTPEGQFQVFQERIRGVEYSIAHYQDSFYIITNSDNATNFKVMLATEGSISMENWKEFIPHKEDVLIEDIDVFKDYLVVSERKDGLGHIKIFPKEGEAYFLQFDNETYTAYTTSNMEFDTPVLRYGYQSLTTPASVIDFDMSTKNQEVKKEMEVLGGQFDKDNYESKRLWAKADDDVLIPMSIVYKKGVKLDGANPLLQYGYGSYGHTIEPTFSSTRLSLLDRGFIFVISHVRGSEYMGRQWYEDGKLLKKKNTFSDFIACSKYLIEHKYTSPKHFYIQGGSAGGLLIGAVINSAPELYHGAIADVPFVDVVTTMLDESIPLTTGEYDEWGNPNEKEYYDYMKSYSPYDNVTELEYPNLLVTTGLHDSQVQYWEPAKWVALLREKKVGDTVLFLDTNMKTGHGGASGRLESLKDIAKEFSFLLKLEAIDK